MKKDVEIIMTGPAFLSIQNILNKYGNVKGGWIVIEDQKDKQDLSKELKKVSIPEEIKTQVDEVIKILDNKNVRQIKIKGNVFALEPTIKEKQIL
jgi:predicted small secreted protein